MSLFQPTGVLTTNNFLVQIHKGPSLRTMPAGLTGAWECPLIPDVRGTAIDRQGSTQVGREQPSGRSRKRTPELTRRRTRRMLGILLSACAVRAYQAGVRG